MRALRELWWALPRLSRAGQGRAVGVLSIWIWWDRFLQRRWQLQPVRPGGIFRYRVVRYRGSLVNLNDGTTIAPGDAIIELHFDNSGLMHATGDAGWTPWAMMAELDADLDALAAMVATGRLGQVRALHGVTLFAIPGRRLGFEVRAVPQTLRWSLERYFLIGWLPIYHPDGWREFDHMRRNRWPGELWMSVDRLLERRVPPTPTLPRKGGGRAFDT